MTAARNRNMDVSLRAQTAAGNLHVETTRTKRPCEVPFLCILSLGKQRKYEQNCKEKF